MSWIRLDVILYYSHTGLNVESLGKQRSLEALTASRWRFPLHQLAGNARRKVQPAPVLFFSKTGSSMMVRVRFHHKKTSMAFSLLRR